MTTESELHSLVQLLDDSDPEVVEIVENKILEQGVKLLPQLEDFWLFGKYPEQSHLLENIIQRIQFKKLLDDISESKKSGKLTDLQAWVFASRIQYPGLTEGMMLGHLNQLRIDAWVKLSKVRNPLDQIQTLNHLFFDVYQFQGNSNNYHHTDNSFINRVLETKLGNPISLAVLYSTVSKALGLPVFGVNLPQHFVLAYCRMETEPNFDGVYPKDELKIENVKSVLFYINPFSKGQIFSTDSIDAFLKTVKIEKDSSYYLPCPSEQILIRMFRNLFHAYSKMNDTIKMEQIITVLRLYNVDLDLDSSNNFN
jgi:regulator of sirC expression with transglutaminase-like and TPR domain